MRNRLLDFCLSIEAVAPDAGDTEPGRPDPVERSTVTQIFNNTITGGQVAFASSGNGAVTQHVTQAQESISSWEDLEQRLREAGVDDDGLTSLRLALAADAHANGNGTQLVVGTETENWLGRLVSRVAAGSVRLAEGIGVEVVAAILAKAATG